MAAARTTAGSARIRRMCSAAFSAQRSSRVNSGVLIQRSTRNTTTVNTMIMAR